jgi:hypothetical protein
MFKLFVSQYQIEFAAFTKAAIAALILGKVILLLDWAESGHGTDKTHRRIVVVAGISKLRHYPLHPLTFHEALKALVNVDPDRVGLTPKRRRTRKRRIKSEQEPTLPSRGPQRADKPQ